MTEQQILRTMKLNRKNQTLQGNGLTIPQTNKSQLFGMDSQYSMYSLTNSEASQCAINNASQSLFTKNGSNKLDKCLEPSSVSTTFESFQYTKQAPLVGYTYNSDSGFKQLTNTTIEQPVSYPTSIQLLRLQQHNSLPSFTPNPPHIKCNQLQQLQETNDQLMSNYSNLYRKYIELEATPKQETTPELIVNQAGLTRLFLDRVNQICSFQLETGLSRLKSTIPEASISTYF